MLDTQLRVRDNKWIEDMEFKYKKRDLVITKDSVGSTILFWKGLLCMELFGVNQKLWLGFKENFRKHCIRKTVFDGKLEDRRNVNEEQVKEFGIYALSSKKYIRNDEKIKHIWEQARITFNLNW
jgi:hypothetical protein